MLYKAKPTDFSLYLNPDKLYSLDPADHDLTNDDIFLWRNHLRERLLELRQYKSDFSGKPLYQVHMHEGIITRANVPKSLSWQILIFHPYNSVLLTPDEHIPNPPSREWCIQWAYRNFGRDAVRNWYYNLPFKKRPFELL